MAATSQFFLSFSFVFLLIHGALCIDLTQTCKKIVESTPNVNLKFCITTLQVVPNICSIDLNDLGLISMNLSKSNATSTVRYIQKILKHKVKPYVKSCLLDCLDLYSGAISSLDIATNDVKIEHYDEANIQMSATIDAPTTCEDGFKERKGTKSPLSKRNGDMFQLSVIALSIINTLSQDRI
ncbi:hypothetical protein ACHQM5_007583 [Ranunculus cassubicifolius]